MLVPDDLLRHGVGRDVVVVEHGGEAILDPAARLAAEEVGQLDRTAVRRILA